MKLTSLSAAGASALAVRALGLDAELVDLTSKEGLAASLRRAASFMCPTSPSRLIDAVLEAVQPVSSTGAVGRDDLAELVDLLVAGGDLLELRHDLGRSVRLLYLGPPSCIEREPGTYVLVGIRPFGAPLIEGELGSAVENECHVRTVRLEADEAETRLAAAGLQCVARDRWVASPRREAPDELLSRLAQRLDASGPSGEIEGLALLDPEASVRYYRGRWRSPKPGDHGNFVARRPQAYGADLWCMVRVEDGNPTRLIEFPVEDPLVPGRDEAWRAQMAVDAVRGTPQRYRTAPAASGDATVVEFFSPIPSFAERYLELVGLPLGHTSGALFSFRIPNGAVSDLEQRLATMLWIAGA